MSPFDVPPQVEGVGPDDRGPERRERHDDPDEDVCRDCEDFLRHSPDPRAATSCDLSEVMDDRALIHLLHVDPPTLWAQLQAGTLCGLFIDGRWLIHRDAVRAWLRTPRGK